MQTNSSRLTSTVCGLIFLLIISAPPPSVRAAGPEDLIAHFKFDGDATDSTGQADIGSTATGGTPTFIPGKIGQGVQFDGTGDWFSLSSSVVGDPVLGTLDSFTISMWIRSGQGDEDITVPRIMAVFRDGELDFNSDNFVIGIDQPATEAGTKVGFESNTLFSGNDFGIVDAVDDSDWYHVAFVVDQSDGVAANNSTKIYVDGVEEGSRNHIGIISFSDNDRVLFGAGWTSPSGPDREYEGDLDDVQVYAAALTEEEIGILFANPGAVVPEPSSLAIGLSLILGLLWFRSRWSRSGGRLPA